MEYLLGFDAGTTSFKCVLYDTSGEAVASGGVEYELSSPKRGYIEFPAPRYFEMMAGLVRDVTAKSGVSPKDIVSMAVSSQGETFICLDAGGNPAHDAIVWLDNRSVREAEELKARFAPREVYEASGQCEMTSTWTATKILWLKRNMPDVFRRTDKFLLLEDYLMFMLTGVYATERSLHCSSLLYDMRTGGWWGEMLDHLGVSEERLPRLFDPGDAVGNVKPSVAPALGLAESTLVIAGAMDQMCALIGSGNIKAGGVSESTGSCLAVCATLDRMPEYRRDVRITCHSHAVGGMYVLMYWAQTAGMVYKWLKEKFYSNECKAAAQGDAGVFELMDIEAAGVSPGANGLIFLPHLEGAQYPEYNFDARGVLFGLTLAHGRPEINRAALESVAYTLRTITDDVKALGIKIPSICASGGGASSALWCSIKASVAGIPVVTSGTGQPACLGAAILAGKGACVYPSVEWACSRLVRYGKEYKPVGEWAGAYDEGYERFVKLYRLLVPMYGE